jgi:hypothetical protein
MGLRLVHSIPPPPPAFELPRIDLERQPTRPGVTHTKIEFGAPAGLARQAMEIARQEGLPDPVWVGLVIESERVIRQACEDQHQAAELRGYLDRVARAPSSSVPGAARRLTEFGKALRGARARPAQRTMLAPDLSGSARMAALIPYQAITAWRRDAIEKAQPFEVWAAERLRLLPRDRLLWEAAAAERGETLGEWVLLHAARR